jgi:hypothetical protein
MIIHRKKERKGEQLRLVLLSYFFIALLSNLWSGLKHSGKSSNSGFQNKSFF